ncbi:MAG TPA: hypothetical protein VHA09_08865 [Nitrososphaera sp.]|nr:hypothetical protein [Nitrososphaera sp.]
MALASGLEILAKSGAIVSAAGVALLVAFVLVLLVFPVTKTCEQAGGNINNSNSNHCKYESSAPAQLQPIFNQGFFALSLLVIAAGILMIRYSRWRDSKAAAQG